MANNNYLNKIRIGNEDVDIHDIRNLAASETDGGAANKAVSIPFAEVDSTSTGSAFTATVSDITELRDGVCVYLRNGVEDSVSGCTLNINSLGAKPIYSSATGNQITTAFTIAYTYLFVYNSTRVSGGCWDLYAGYENPNASNTSAYIVRTNSQRLPTTDKFYRYRILFTSLDGTHYIPATTSTSTNATSARTVNQRVIDPFGRIVYYNSTTAINAEAMPGATALRDQSTATLGYSFNRAGAALTLTKWKPVYLKCAPQTTGGAIIDADTPYVQDLPATEDGKIYIFLGVAYSATAIEMLVNHPIYWYKDGAVRLWTNTTALTNSEIDTIWTNAMVTIITITMTGGDTLIFSDGIKADGTSLNGTYLRTGESIDIISAPITVRLLYADTSSGFWWVDGLGTNYEYTLANGDTYYVSNRYLNSRDVVTLTPIAKDITVWADVD